MFDGNKLKFSVMQCETELPLNQSRNSTHGHKTKETESPASVQPYDICRPKSSPTVVLKPSILECNRERRNQAKRNMDMGSRVELRPGMILLKGYISLSDQVPQALSLCVYISVVFTCHIYMFILFERLSLNATVRLLTCDLVGEKHN